MDAGNTERQITEEQIRRFAENLKRQEYGAGTIENYVRSIRAFSGFRTRRGCWRGKRT